MACKRLLPQMFVVLFASASAHGQLSAQHTPDVRAFDDDQTRGWVLKALSTDIPDYKVDELSFLALNHPRIVIPLLADRISVESRLQGSRPEFIRKMADALAYTAEPDAVIRLAQFAANDGPLFGYYIDRSLDYAMGRRNPYALAYEVADRSDPTATDRVLRWVENSLLRQSRRAEFINAAVAHHGAQLTPESLESDAIVSKLRATTRELLKNDLASRLAPK